MNDTIKIYAPVDCVVKELKDLQDGVFSEGLLGIGVYIEPKKQLFYAPMKGRLVQIFDTKHAIHFKDENENILMMHIGIESVKLNGEGFNLKAKLDQLVDTNSEIIDVDFKLFKAKKILTATPLVVEQEAGFNFDIKTIKLGPAKKGDLILEIKKSKIQVAETKKEDILKDSAGHILPVIYTDKYRDAFKWIMQSVKSKENIVNVSRCNTRLRLVLKDKDNLDQNLLKNSRIIRGSVLNGNELQVIIGPEVQKFYDIFNKYLKEYKQTEKESHATKKKTPFRQRALNVINGILIPVLPAFLAASLVLIIRALLDYAGVITAINTWDLGWQEVMVDGVATQQWQALTDFDIFSGIIYLLSQTVWALIGVWFSFTTVRYLGGDSSIGILIGLTLAAPFLIPGGFSWDLFEIGGFTFSIGSYASSIIPHIVAGVIFVYVDRWIKSWMPASISLIFTYSLGYIITILSIFFFLGPILLLLEALFYFIVIEGLENIRFGNSTIGINIGTAIGVSIFGFIWQPIVLTGIHAAIFIPLDAQVNSGVPSTMALINSGIAALGQFGAAAAVIFVARNAKLRQTAIVTSPTALIGITEPAIYGVNLVKVTPFIAGCIGAAIGGFYLGITGTQRFQLAGGGILIFLGSLPADGVSVAHLINVIIGMLITIVSSFLFVLFLYKERISELFGIKKIYKKISIIANDYNVDKSPFITEMNETLKVYSKDTNKFIKGLEKKIYLKNLLELKVELLNEKESTKLSKISLKAQKAYEKEKFELVEKYNQMCNNINIDKTKYIDKINNLTKEIDLDYIKYNQLSEQVSKITKKSVDRIVKETKVSEFKELTKNFDRCIYSLQNNVNHTIIKKENLFNYNKFKRNLKKEAKLATV